MPDIFKFTDYRKFIKAWYTEQKQRRPRGTYRTIADALGFNSPAHVLMILKNKAKLSENHALRLAGFMGLNKKETSYLLHMVNYNQCRSMDEKNRYLRKMVRLNKTGTVLLKPDQYEYYQKWFYAAIHDILSFYPFQGDFGELAKMVDPPIARREAQKAVALLERLRFITKKDDGTYSCEHPGISAYAEGHSLALSSYAEAMMIQARQALRKFRGDERSISWAGFSMSKATFEKVNEEAREFRKRVIAMAQADTSPDRAYHINMQIFPVSSRLEPNTEKKGDL
ncbi:MAG: TIGR02147 family protein [Chitinispirillaceae bacterium]|nr:TIGR02147 family protein [Chitinispirillaceae bacterium]